MHLKRKKKNFKAQDARKYKGGIENTKNKSGGNEGIGFPESTTVTKFVEPTLDEKLRNISSDILTAITQTVYAKLTKFEQKINKHYKTFADATQANLPKEKDDDPTNFRNIVMEAIEEKNSEKKKEKRSQEKYHPVQCDRIGG